MEKTGFHVYLHLVPTFPHNYIIAEKGPFNTSHTICSGPKQMVHRIQASVGRGPKVHKIQASVGPLHCIHYCKLLLPNSS